MEGRELDTISRLKEGVTTVELDTGTVAMVTWPAHLKQENGEHWVPCPHQALASCFSLLTSFSSLSCHFCFAQNVATVYSCYKGATATLFLYFLTWVSRHSYRGASQTWVVSWWWLSAQVNCQGKEGFPVSFHLALACVHLCSGITKVEVEQHLPLFCIRPLQGCQRGKWV